jgi:protein phosphatase
LHASVERGFTVMDQTVRLMSDPPPEPPEPARRWRGAGLSDVGRVRKTNQDAFAVCDRLGLWIVADGMGGHAGGEVASRLAVDTLVSWYDRRFSTEPADTLTPLTHEQASRSAVAAANEAIRSEAERRPLLRGMGTTVVFIRISGSPRPHMLVAHVGDSRVYLLRDGRLQPLTKDHSWVEEQIALGALTPDAAQRHPMRHMLTRALGSDSDTSPDVSFHRLRPSDRFLLCSDGLTKMLSDADICRTLAATPGDPAASCQALVEQAIRMGGKDNVTVLVVQS